MFVYHLFTVYLYFIPLTHIFTTSNFVYIINSWFMRNKLNKFEKMYSRAYAKFCTSLISVNSTSTK